MHASPKNYYGLVLPNEILFDILVILQGDFVNG